MIAWIITYCFIVIDWFYSVMQIEESERKKEIKSIKQISD